MNDRVFGDDFDPKARADYSRRLSQVAARMGMKDHAAVFLAEAEKLEEGEPDDSANRQAGANRQA